MKTDTPKTVPIPSLRTVTSNVSPRFMPATVSANINTVPLTIQNPGGKPITIPNSGGPTGHKSDVTIAVLPMTNRIIPTSGAPTSGYHIPRGPAAVANITIPRGSMASPVRSVATSAGSGNSSFMPVPGLSVLRSHWIVTTSGATPTTNIRPITSSVPVRHASMTVASKVATGPRMHIDQQNSRPQTVLLQKQIISGPTTSQMVRMSDGNQGFIKTALPLRNPSPRIISTTQGGKLPMFPILVPSNAPLLKTQTQTPIGTKVMVSQPTHGTPIQITSVPHPTTIKTTGGFQTSSNNPMSTSSTLVTPVKPSGHPVIVTSTPVSNFSKYSPNIVNTSSTSSFTPGSNTSSYYFEQNPPTSNPNYPISTSSAGSLGPAQHTTGSAMPSQHSGVRLGSNFSPVVTTLSHPRPGLHPQPSTILTAPRGMGASQFSFPVNRVSAPQPSVLVSSRPQLITSSIPGSTSIGSSTGPPGPRFSQVSTLSTTPMPMPLIHDSQSRMMNIPVSSEGSGDESSHVQSNMTISSGKPNASPRPSILRKRDLDASTPLKGQKNLTPMLNAQPMSVSNTISTISNISSCNVSNTINAVSCNITSTINAVSTLPPSPSSPPKRPDSGSGSSCQSSSSSVSSSNGGGPPPPESMDVAPPTPHEEPPLGANTTALISGLILSNCPVEMSPRKKPRKQLLTGDLQERKMEVEDMEFITEEKIKSEQQRDDYSSSDNMSSGQGVHNNPAIPAEPPPPANKKPHVSLLNSYRQGWKSRHHHFMRYSDVKAKDERRPSLSDIASQKQILQKVNGWKIYHLRTQMENMATLEKEHSSKLTALLETFEKTFDSSDREVNRVNELIKGNIQRNNVVQDQLLEAHDNLMKIFEHKNTVTDLITKNGNRRTIKKKDKY